MKSVFEDGNINEVMVLLLPLAIVDDGYRKRTK